MLKHLLLVLGILVGTLLSVFIMMFRISSYERSFLGLTILFFLALHLLLFYTWHLAVRYFIHYETRLNYFLLGFLFSVFLHSLGQVVEILRGVLIKDEINSLWVTFMCAPIAYFIVSLLDWVKNRK